uniref:Uncharacterized protein n=1 Tax=Ascaris lumbricoides TaxID=6252 RepID=A0A0M3HFQ9_ASCLU
MNKINEFTCLRICLKSFKRRREVSDSPAHPNRNPPVKVAIPAHIPKIEK